MDSLLHMFPISSPWCQDEIEKDSKQPGKTKEFLSRPASNMNHNPVVLLGSPNGGKTSLLFQAAVSYAAKDLHVTYICPQPLSRVPLNVHGMPKPQANVLNNVKFLYINNTGDLLNYCAAVHTSPLLPDVLIVDDVDFYLGSDNQGDHGAAKLCAFLIDTVCYINSKVGPDHCQLLLGCRDCLPTLPAVFKKFGIIPAFITFSKEEKTHTVQLKTKDLNSITKFTIKPSGIFLQTIELHKS